ncbi:hypothetical protein AX15_005357 [Amanita polypyramis BW_CC]|nr:hypothetical protein AX15_005357 [Amanita polypyramis BW_CC]
MAEAPPPPPFSFPTHEEMELMDRAADTLSYRKNLEVLEDNMDRLVASATSIRQVFNNIAGDFMVVYYYTTNEDLKYELKVLQEKWESYRKVVYLVLCPFES